VALVNQCNCIAYWNEDDSPQELSYFAITKQSVICCFQCYCFAYAKVNQLSPPESAFFFQPETMARSLPAPLPVSPLVRGISDLGQHVRNARARQTLRIDDAAALCGVSSAVLSRLENGRPVTLDKLVAVLDGLGLRLLVVPARHARMAEDGLQELDAAELVG